MRGLALGLWLLALAGCQAPSQVGQGGPALWSARDNATTVYLFGTKHVVSASTRWLTPRIASALADSGELWVESDLRDQGAAARALVGRGIDPGYDLAAATSEAAWPRLRGALTGCGLPGDKVAHARPWFAVFILTVCAETSPSKPGGARPVTTAPDMLLVGLAGSSGKPVHGFESAAQQVAALAALSDADALRILEAKPQPAAQAAAGGALLAFEEQAWARGDVAALETLILAPARSANGAFLEAILDRRNQGFANGILDLFRQRRSAFVAVGAAHLIGSGSVIELLRARGVTVTRVN